MFGLCATWLPAVSDTKCAWRFDVPRTVIDTVILIMCNSLLLIVVDDDGADIFYDVVAVDVDDDFLC